MARLSRRACLCLVVACAAVALEERRATRDDFEVIADSSKPPVPYEAPPPSSLEVIVAGTLGSMVGEVVSFPCDVLKTEVLSTGSSVVAAARHLLRGRDASRFYAGLAAPLAGAFFIKGTVFGARELFKALLHPGRGGTLLEGALSAFGAGAVASAVVAPVERVKIVCQLAGGARSTAATLRDLWRGGTLFLGADATFWREAPQYAAYFTIYEFSRPRVASAAVAGGLAGALSWLAILPVDVAKTRVQSGREARFGPALASALGSGSRLLNGVGPVVARALVKHAAVFASYEVILAALASARRRGEL